MIKKTKEIITEEDVIIHSYIETKNDNISSYDIPTKKMPVFYNPIMKLNRDISLLVIESYFNKEITFCDPMCATGIREIRFLKKIPNKFKKLYCSDLSPSAINSFKKNLELNNISKEQIEKIEFKISEANSIIHDRYYDFIEIDPFGSPAPFIDSALQKIKHKGILSVTATDTAALCGTYPKTTFRRYGIKIDRTLFEEELGIRNLIAFCQINSARYDKTLTPIISFSYKHFYKIFFIVEEGKTKANQMLKELKYFTYDKNTQNIEFLEYENKETLGKTYINSTCNKEFLKKMQKNLNLIEDNKIVTKLLEKLYNELDTFGYYNTHKLQKSFKISSEVKFETIFEKLEEKGYTVSKVHDNIIGIKTDANYEILVDILKNN